MAVANRRVILAVIAVASVVAPAWGDRQAIAPGTGLQSAVEVDTGPNGICETAAMGDDLQGTPIGRGTPFTDEIRCGPDGIANTAAAGDDRQLIAVGAACDGANRVVVDTGPDGIANSTAVGDDTQEIPVGAGMPHTPCVITGANGVADTQDPVGGDDGRILLRGSAQANTAVIRCGPNHIAETSANNVAAGDDVQRVGVGASCSATNTVVVDSGPNGIAETRAQGTDLVLAVPTKRPLTLTIHRRHASASKGVKVVVFNREFGATAPAGRAYALLVDDGSCPSGTVSAVDAGGGQPTAIVPLRGKVKGHFVVTLRLEDITSVARNIPFRCTVDVQAQALDSAPDSDDAVNPNNNAARIEIEAVDLNDL